MNAGSDMGMPSVEEVDLAVEVFRMLSDRTRLRILWYLQQDEQSVSELAIAVDKAPAAVSQHLAKLRLARLVQTRRDGNTIYYRLDSDHAHQLVVDAIHHAEHQDPDVPRHHRDAAGVHQLPHTNEA